MTGSISDTLCDCKVGRQIARHGLEDLNPQLRNGRQGDDLSLRELAAFVNTRVLEAAMRTADADVVGDPRSVYETLTAEDVAPERRADLRDQLEFAGIDVDEIRGDFVSHQTMKDHLNNCLGVDTSRDGIRSIEDGKANITWSRDRHKTVLENTLKQLCQANLLSIGDYELSQTTTLTCTDCNRSYRLDEFLNVRQCECNDDLGSPNDEYKD